jgi:hypothetical protein
MINQEQFEKLKQVKGVLAEISELNQDQPEEVARLQAKMPE